MAVGAYTAATLTKTLGAELLPLVGGQPWVLLPLALLGGGLTAALSGFLVGAPSLRLKGDYLAIVTLGFGEIIKVILQNVEFVGGALGMNGIPTTLNPAWSGVIVFATLAAPMLTVYVVWGLLNSTYGRGFLAVADDEVAAEAMGLNTTRYKITAFVVGAFFAGVAGGLYAHIKGALTPGGFDFNKSIEIVVMVILGGMGRHVGVIVAAVLLTVLSETLRRFGDYRMILYSVLLIVLMLTRPQGLFSFTMPDKSRAVHGANVCSLWILGLTWLGSVLGRLLTAGTVRPEHVALFAIRAAGVGVTAWILCWAIVRLFGKTPREPKLS
jgi:branched-chain amino acid transport system permease protein